MATLKERLKQWKESRSAWQKAGDIFFWLLLILLIIPGPRKVISTTVNRVFLTIKNPAIDNENNQQELSDRDYNWQLARNAEATLNFSDLRGKVVFLNFWATWCPPCVAELPEIQRAYEKHGDEVAFVLVTDQEAGVVEAFMNKHGYELPVFYLRSGLPEAFSHRSIPTTYIISKEGRIVSEKSGAVNWDSKATDKMFESLLR
ncbi:MAG: TlpA disulfide reductase family protein [Bacteroidota bacterium]